MTAKASRGKTIKPAIVIDAQIPPHAEELERALVGSVLMGGRPIMQMVEWLQPGAFLFLRHTWIWETMRKLYHAGSDLDTLTIAAQLAERGQLDDCGGTDYLNRVTSDVVSAWNAETYAELVHREQIARQMRGAAGEIATVAADADLTLSEKVEQARQALELSVVDFRPEGTLTPTSETVSAMFDRFGMGNKTRLPLGFGNVNTILRGGLRAGRLMYLGARPAMGKSLLLLAFAKAIAEQGHPIMYATLEMPIEDNIFRLCAMHTGLTVDEIEQTYEDGDGPNRETVSAALEWAYNLPIYWSTTARTPRQVRDDLKLGMRMYGIEALAGDHLNLMRTGDDKVDRNDYARQTYCSRRMKELNIETGLPMVWAVQLSRACEQRQDKRPLMSDLRDSGAIEEDADVIAMLYRDEYYNPETTETPGVMEVLFRKNRQGPTDNALMGCNLPTMKLTELTRRTL